MPASKPTATSKDLVTDLARCRAFVAIAKSGSLTRAAIALDRSQSLLSRQIGAMERDYGARLFKRTGRGVVLSEVGLRIHPHVEALLDSVKQLEGEVRGEMREPAGEVTLGLLPSISSALVCRLYPRLRATHPSVGLRILDGSSGQVEEWLADGRVDIAVLYRYGASLPRHEQSLATVDSYLVGARGDKLTSAAEVPFKRLDGLPFVLPGAPNGLRHSLDAAARKEGISLRSAIVADSLPLMKLLVARERLYTVMPVHAVWQEVEEGTLQAARVVSPRLKRTVTMAMARSKTRGKAVSTVAQEIERMVAEMAQEGMWRPGLRARRA